MTQDSYPIDTATVSDLEDWLEDKSGVKIDTQEFKRKVELHKVGKLSDKEVVKLCMVCVGGFIVGKNKEVRWHIL